MARSTIMGLHALKNSPKVNHFDQSYRHCFSAKSGEILPVYYNMLFPGDKIKVNASSLTKTSPLNTYAFTRLRENIQFFAVRLSSLWRFFPDIYKNMPTDLYGNSTSRIAQDSLTQVTLSTSLPYFNNIKLRNALADMYAQCSNQVGGRSEYWTASKVYEAIVQSESPESSLRDSENYLKNSVTGYVNNAYTHDINLRTSASDDDPAILTSGWNFSNLRNGVLRYQSTAKLLSMLGYGDFSAYYTDDFNNNSLSAQIPTNSKNSVGLSVFPLLAYHKICQDHYKYRQWQSFIPQICNIDYVGPTSVMDLSHVLTDQLSDSVENGYSENFDLDSPTILDLEFSNLPLDYLNGVLPNSQFGDMSVAPLINIPTSVDTIKATDDSTMNLAPENILKPSALGPRTESPINLATGSPQYIKLVSSEDSDPGLRIDALRKSLQLQRYKEIQMSSDTSYQDLIEKHFGIRPKNIAPFNSQYIGGYDTNFDINPQVNQNLSGENTATFGAAPLASGNGTISYSCEDEPVIVLGLYTCVPQMDYENVGYDRRLLLTDATDFPIPEMDSIGMQTTYLSELYTPNESASALSDVDVKRTFGYAPRYAEWKTARDLVSGCFSTPAFRHWTNPFPKDYLRSLFYYVGNPSSLDPSPTSIPAFLFKNSPWWLSRVFANERMLSVSDDFLFVGAFFKVDVTRRLSKYGLPYAS